MKIRNCNSCSQCGEVGMLLGHVGASFRRECIHLRSRDAGVEALNDLLCDRHWVHVLLVQAITKCTDSLCNVVKLDFLALAVSLKNIHALRHCIYTRNDLKVESKDRSCS